MKLRCCFCLEELEVRYDDIAMQQLVGHDVKYIYNGHSNVLDWHTSPYKMGKICLDEVEDMYLKNLTKREVWWASL